MIYLQRRFVVLLQVLMLAVLVLVLSGCAAPAMPVPATVPVSSVGITPQDIPVGYDYPGERLVLQKWADEWKIEDITAHSWHLWAGMTADSGQTYLGAHLPYWETWCGNEEVFTNHDCTLKKPSHSFVGAKQLNHAGQPKADAQVVTFNKFNPAMAKYLAEKHDGPDGKQYRYTSMQDLADLNAAWPAGTASSARTVVEAPYTPTTGGVQGSAAMETKPVIFIVKSTGLTPLPLWPGQPGSAPVTGNPTPGTWTTCILIDPANPAKPDTSPIPATPEQIKNIVPKSTDGLSCDPAKYLYAPLSVIWGFAMNKDEAESWNVVQSSSADNLQSGLMAVKGDWAVLVAMHVNTKEIKNWTWQTFWWQPGADTPGNFPGSKQGMTSDVKDAWRNYAMCTAWNQTEGNGSTKMNICFNPYLETSTGIPLGVTSNCMSCHGQASVGGLICSKGSNAINTLIYPGGSPTPPAPSTPIDYSKPVVFGDPNFTLTDFSWAIPSELTPTTCK